MTDADAAGDLACAGLVLAGGRSRRFGETDKAAATVGGEPVLRRAATGLAPAVDSLAVSCREEQIGRFRDLLAGVEPTPRFVPDPVAGFGPLAGLVAGATAVDAPRLAVVAGDQPFVAPILVTRLLKRFERDEEPLAVLATVDDEPDPTNAVYRTAAVERTGRRLLRRGTRRLGALVDALGRTDEMPTPASLRRSLFDVDTPADWRRARRTAEEHDRPADGTPTGEVGR